MKKAAIGTSISLAGAVALGAMSIGVNADENPFAATELGQGYELADGHGKDGEGECGGKTDDEGSCGGKSDTEGKCGEGKCGS